MDPYEYSDSHTGQGDGAAGDGWTSAVFVDMLIGKMPMFRGIIVHAILGGLLGLALAATLILGAAISKALPASMGEAYGVFFEVLNWPVAQVVSMDKRYRWGILYENPIPLFAVIGLYWVLVGEVVYWAIGYARTTLAKSR